MRSKNIYCHVLFSQVRLISIVFVILCSQFFSILSAQVTYDNNAVVIGAMAQTSVVQSSFTVPTGTDRLLVAFVMRDGSFSTFTDSITFDGQFLTKQIEKNGDNQLNVEIWYVTLGCGPAISSPLVAKFSNAGGGNLPDAIVSVATFQNVDQFTVFGGFDSKKGMGSSSSSLNISTTLTNGLMIGMVGTESTNLISISPQATGQIEIYETDIAGNNNAAQGSIKTTTGGSDDMFWSFMNFCEYAAVVVELLASDIDGDGTPDCNDLCPADPLKIDPGVCGCGISDTDTDMDGTADCNDLCPSDPLKIDPGICGCGVSETDSDADGTPDCNDLCPSDPLKIDPGTCGCGVSETDSDADGTPDCNDLCPADPLKTDPGDCGCGVVDVDTDGDGVADCIDNCPAIANADQTDTDNDGIGEVCDDDNEVVRVSDPNNNILFEVNDEGLVGSITLRDTTIHPIITADKLYGVDGSLFYNGSSIGSTFTQTGNLILQNSTTFYENFIFGREMLPDNSMIADTFFFFDQSRAAFRGGLLTNETKPWQPDSIGNGSFAYGENLYAPSFGEVAMGINNENYIPNSTSAFDGSDRVFSIGNGNGTMTGQFGFPQKFSNAFTVLKNGHVGIGTSTPATDLDLVGNMNVKEGEINMRTASGINTITIDPSETGTAGSSKITLRTNGGVSTVEMDAHDGTSGRVSVSNLGGTNTIILNGNAGAGKGKITTDIIEIKGGSDFAEYFEVNDTKESIQPGMVVCIDEKNEGGLVLSQQQYDRKVIGVISGANGIDAGMVMGQKGTMAFGDHPVSLIGRVYVRCNEENGEIMPGDFLTTSSVPGEAMRVSNHVDANGSILGKALSMIDPESGFVLVFVNLQ